MTKRFLAVAITGAILAVMMTQTGAAADKPRIAVLNFENQTGWGGWQLGNQAADMLVTQLVKTKAFSVYERAQLEELMKEQNLGASGRVTSSTAAQIGKLAGLEYVIIGAVTQFGQESAGASGFRIGVKRNKYESKIDVRMVNVNTGEIVDVWEESSSAANVKIRVFGRSGGTDYDPKMAQEVLQDAINKVAKQIAASAG